MFPQKSFLKSLKATELFRKHIFKLKVVNQVGESPGGTLAATTLLGAHFSCYFCILSTSHTRQNLQEEALCL